MYLEGKPNAYVLSQSHSKRLIIEDGKATGVEVYGPDGETTYEFHASREVIVSSGVFETPKLLLLSGIGPRATLDAFGVPVAVESPHVGRNLLDHPILPHVFRLKDGVGLDHHLLRAGPEQAAATAAYRRDRTGPYGSGLLELVAFPRIDERLKATKEYREYLEKNGDVDPFGPSGQPHFEIDFVVSRKTTAP